MSAPTLRADDLRNFTGSETFYRHPMNRKIVFTEGVKYVADTAGAYWLIDELAFAQRYQAKVAAENFQAWKLTVNDDHSAELRCEDGNHNFVFEKRIDWTDFPLPEISLWLVGGTILLPSEY
jgi:hypothetical protein